MTESLLTPTDLAERLGGEVTARKVLDWRKQFNWPSVEVGRTVRFTEEMADEIITRHTKRPKPQEHASGLTALSAARA